MILAALLLTASISFVALTLFTMYTRARLLTLQKNIPDIQYLYVYQIMEDGCHVIFDTDEENDQYGWLLTYYHPVYDSNGKCQRYVGVDISRSTFYFLSVVLGFLPEIITLSMLIQKKKKNGRNSKSSPPPL